MHFHGHLFLCPCPGDHRLLLAVAHHLLCALDDLLVGARARDELFRDAIQRTHDTANVRAAGAVVSPELQRVGHKGEQTRGVLGVVGHSHIGGSGGLGFQLHKFRRYHRVERSTRGNPSSVRSRE